MKPPLRLEEDHVFVHGYANPWVDDLDILTPLPQSIYAFSSSPTKRYPVHTVADLLLAILEMNVVKDCKEAI